MSDLGTCWKENDEESSSSNRTYTRAHRTHSKRHIRRKMSRNVVCSGTSDSSCSSERYRSPHKQKLHIQRKKEFLTSDSYSDSDASIYSENCRKLNQIKLRGKKYRKQSMESSDISDTSVSSERSRTKHKKLRGQHKAKSIYKDKSSYCSDNTIAPEMWLNENRRKVMRKKYRKHDESIGCLGCNRSKTSRSQNQRHNIHKQVTAEIKWPNSFESPPTPDRSTTQENHSLGVKERHIHKKRVVKITDSSSVSPSTETFNVKNKGKKVKKKSRYSWTPTPESSFTSDTSTSHEKYSSCFKQQHRDKNSKGKNSKKMRRYSSTSVQCSRLYPSETSSTSQTSISSEKYRSQLRQMHRYNKRDVKITDSSWESTSPEPVREKHKGNKFQKKYRYSSTSEETSNRSTSREKYSSKLTHKKRHNKRDVKITDSSNESTSPETVKLKHKGKILKKRDRYCSKSAEMSRLYSSETSLTSDRSTSREKYSSKFMHNQRHNKRDVKISESSSESTSPETIKLKHKGKNIKKKDRYSLTSVEMSRIYTSETSLNSDRSSTKEKYSSKLRQKHRHKKRDVQITESSSESMTPKKVKVKHQRRKSKRKCRSEPESEYVEARILRTDWDLFLNTWKRIHNGDPQTLTTKDSCLSENFNISQQKELTTRKSEANQTICTNGSKEGVYVPTLSKRNIKYTEGDLKPELGTKMRDQWLSAMRSRRYRQGQNSVGKKSNIRQHEKRSNMAPEKVRKLREQGLKRQQNFRNKQKERRESNLKKRAYRQKQKTRSNLCSTVQSPYRSKCSLEGSSVKTPQEYDKKIRQRVSKCENMFPRDRKYSCFVLGRLVKKRIISPSTRPMMTQLLNRQHTTIANHDVTELQNILRKVVRYKSRNNPVLFQRAVTEFKKKASLREASRLLNIHYSTLHRIMTEKGPYIRAVGRESVLEEDKRRVQEFYSSTQVSCQMPYKKYAGKHYLRSTLAVAYHQYALKQVAAGDRVLSKTAVYRCLKGVFRTRKKIPFKDCQCATCLNHSLLTDALIVSGVKGIHRSNTKNVIQSFCRLQKQNVKVAARKLDLDGNTSSDEMVLTDYNRECIYRECQKCGVTRFQEEIINRNPNVDWSKIVTWHRWETVEVVLELPKRKKSETDGMKEAKKRGYDKVRYTGTLSQLLALFIQKIEPLSVHIFDFRWQAFQFDECKKLLEHGDILMIMDFAQNHSHHRQDEVQSAHWSRKSTTLHPIITYYPCNRDDCEECENLIKEEIMIFSDDLNHDGCAVNKFIEKVIEHLKQKYVLVKRLIMFSDNCATQYKSCKVFDTLSKQEIPVMRNYFGASHGKGEADGAIGRVAMKIDEVVRSGSFELADCSQLATYFQMEETKVETHYERHYYEVSNIERVQDKDIKYVSGTLGFHSVRNTGIEGVIEVRASSCFCEPCFLGTPGECKNKKLVKPFEWTCLQKITSTRGKAMKAVTLVENTHWKQTSTKYVPVRRVASRRSKANGTKKNIISSQKDLSESSDSFDEWNFNEEYLEDRLPLKFHTGAKDTSAVSSRTRTRLNMKQQVLCTEGTPQIDLNFYENGKGEGSLNHTRLLSGISPLSPGEGTSRVQNHVNIPSETNRRISDDDISAVTELTNAETRRRIDSSVSKGKSKTDTVIDLTKLEKSQKTKRQKTLILNSTPKTGQVIDHTDTGLAGLSPILPVSEKKSFVIDLSIENHQVTSDYRDGTKVPKKFWWKSLYDRFLSCKTFGAIALVVEGALNKIPPLPDTFVGDTRVTYDKIDRRALKLIPEDIPAKFINDYAPICISPDGDCFVHSLSRFVYGIETHHLEMRCRLVIDSVLNIKNYTNHDYLMREASHLHGENCEHIGDYYCTYSGINNIQGDTTDLDVIQRVFKRDILRIREQGQYCDNWQIHSAANILKSKIIMIFPTRNIRANVRADMNRVFLPSTLEYKYEFGLLWTSLLTEPIKYDHIVPLVKSKRPVVELRKLPEVETKLDGAEKKKSNTKSSSVQLAIVEKPGTTETKHIKKPLSGKKQMRAKTETKQVSSKVNSSSSKTNSCVKKCRKSGPNKAHAIHKSNDIKPSISHAQGATAKLKSYRDGYRDGKDAPQTKTGKAKYYTKKVRIKTESTQDSAKMETTSNKDSTSVKVCLPYSRGARNSPIKDKISMLCGEIGSRRIGEHRDTNEVGVRPIIPTSPPCPRSFEQWRLLNTDEGLDTAKQYTGPAIHDGAFNEMKKQKDNYVVMDVESDNSSSDSQDEI